VKSIKKSRKELVAIIGMAGIFPQAKDLQTYWQNILTGVDCITDVPPVNPEELAELRTLAQIVGYMERQSTEDEKKTLTT